MARQEEGPTALTPNGTKDGESGSSAPEAFAARLQHSYLNFRWPLFLLDPEERHKTLPGKWLVSARDGGTCCLLGQFPAAAYASCPERGRAASFSSAH